MKKLLIALYILIVAAISVSARADVDLVVTEATVDQNAQVILVKGHFPNPCVGQAQVNAELSESNTIALKFSAQPTAEVCIEVVGAPVALVVDAANIKHQLAQKGHEVRGEYVVHSDQAQIKTTFNFDSIMPRPDFSVNARGEVVQIQNGFVLKTQDTVTRLVSPYIELESLVGATVVVTGHVNTQDLIGTDVLRSRFKRSESSFIVTGLRLVEKD
jgi:hypothetical protein